MTNDKHDHFAEEKQPKDSKKKARSGIASVSFIIALLDGFGDWIYNSLINGLFGKIFTSYSKIQLNFEKSVSGKTLLGRHRVRKFFRRIRQILAGAIDSCFCVSVWQKAVNYFCSIPLHFYGNFTVFFGIYTLVIYFVKLFIPGIGSADPNYLIIGISLIVAAIPMILSKVSLAYAMQKSIISSMILKGAFGFSEETFENKDLKIRGRGNYMLFLGLVAGTMTLFVHPLSIIAGIFGIVLISLIATTPEIGVLVSIAILPFLTFLSAPTLWLCTLIVITAFFYTIKLIRGKRIFKIEILDVFILLFGLTILFSSFFSAGGISSLNAALISSLLILGYFLLVNLMRTQKWIKRCIYALIGSASIVAFVGVFEYFLGEKSGRWLDLSLFSDIRLRVVSLFENPNMLSTFLVLVFPFLLAVWNLATNKNEKLLCAMLCIAFVLCTVFTWSRGAWLAMIITTVLFLWIRSKKTFRIFGLALLLIPALPIILPENIINRLLSITNLSDSSISYRLYTWKGTLAAIKDYFFAGIGYGNEAFKNVYPNYAYAGIEAAEHSHSLFLQIFLSTGIIGIIIFGILLILCLQKMFEYIKMPQDNTSKIFTVAAISSLIAALIMGVFDYIWYNNRVFYIFWIVISIGCAFVRVGNYEKERAEEDF